PAAPSSRPARSARLPRASRSAWNAPLVLNPTPSSLNLSVISDQVRRTFLEFFQAHGHVLMPSSSLVPLNDPTVLLTPAGMHQMQPFFLGKAKPPAKRLTSCQKCFRTTDIETVGNERNLTFFEMLGNFSVGDYFKEGAIEFAWELLRKGYGLAEEKLHVTCHPTDDEAPALWRKIGVPQ